MGVEVATCFIKPRHRTTALWSSGCDRMQSSLHPCTIHRDGLTLEAFRSSTFSCCSRSKHQAGPVSWKDGYTMLHWAAGKNHVELCKYLLRLQADVNAQDRRKRTALDIAKEKGNLEVIAVLENSEAYKDLDETSSESAEDVSELSEDDDDDPPENTASKSSRRATIHASTMEQEVTLWLEEVTGCEKKGKRSFAEWLRDGQVLCQAVNAVQPGTISKINTQATAFKQMENITLFT